MPKTPKHILVIRLSSMGDVAMCVPVLRAVTKQYPEVKLTVLTRTFFTPFFRDIPNVTVFPLNLESNYKGIIGLYKLSKTLKKLNIDAIADLHNVLRTKILKVFFFGKQIQQINKGRAEKKALITGKKFEQLKTTHERYADVFRNLGLNISLLNPIFPNPYKIHEQAQKVISNDTKNWVGIAPFAQYESKMYPLDLMEEVIKTISKTYKIILFGGGKEEIKVLRNLENKYKNVVNIAGLYSLEQELNIISNLEVMLSMDSSNAHIAAMLGKKVITIWNVTHPYAGFTAYNQPKSYSIIPNLKEFPLIPTSIYGNKYPKHYINAARNISPEVIIKKIKSVL